MSEGTVANSADGRHGRPVRQGGDHPSAPASRQPLQSVARMARAPEGQKPRLLDQVRKAIRTRHYRLRTEEAYVSWIKRCILFHGKRHPLEMGEDEVTRFLSALAVHAQVSASTQNQALCARLFLYREVLVQDVGWLNEVVRAKRPRRLPVVLTRHEVNALLSALQGIKWIMANVLYGAGLRLLECLRLRVQDVAFEMNQIVVREGKGNKDRVTMLPVTVRGPLATHVERVRTLYQQDLERGLVSVYVPDALQRKYPQAEREWGWPWVFPASGLSIDPRSGEQRRHHLDESVLQRAVKEAAFTVGLARPVSCHNLRHYADSRTLPSDV